ncbi:MAG: hypothetical protein FWF90_17425 [Promicromonosporaceae bacterium]|nr:hypothetical protein [Promicromonosporaceae bacterium]
MTRTPILADTPADELDAGMPFPEFDATKPMIVSAWGRKGSGKSYFNRRLYRGWPFDKLAVDVNGDADPGAGAEPLRELGRRWPDAPAGVADHRTRYQNLVYRADPGSATYDEDLDRAVGMAMFPQDRRTLIWCGEVAEFMPSAQKTRPHMRRLLQQNRHYSTTALFDGPRPAHVNPLVLHQSDYVAVFHLPNPDDRERIAKSIGYPADRFHAECHETFRRGEHWYLLWDAREHKLLRCPPLPPLNVNPSKRENR